MSSRLFLLATIGAVSLALAEAPALAASQCDATAARQAFDVEGLKSELMVTALSCNQQDRYNAFMAKFRPAVADQEQALNRYFSNSYGRAAQREHDSYITQLANVQSERGLQAGTQFCDQRVSMFDEVAALDSATDLGGYAEAKDIVQPANYGNCAAVTPVREVRRSRSVRSHIVHGRHRA